MPRRHPKRPPVAQDQTPDDAFIARIIELTVWAKRNSRALIAGTVAFALLLVGFLYYRQTREAFLTQALARLMEVEQTVATGNVPLAIRDLEMFLAQFGSTPPASQARVHLGQLYIEAGEPEKTVNLLQDLAKTNKDPLSTSAAFLLAAAYEELEEPESAESIYLHIADTARFDHMKRQALDDAARLRIGRGEPGRAVELYERALELTPPDTRDFEFLEMRLGEARALAAITGRSNS